MEDTHGIECRIGHRVANTRSKVFKYGPYKWAFVQWHAPARINHQKEFRNNRINRLSWNQFYIWNAKLRWLKAVWMSLLNPRSAVLIHLIKDRIHWKSKIHGSLSECLWRHLCHESIPISWRAWSIGSSPYLEKTGPAAGNAAGWRRNLELPIHGSSRWKLLKVSKMTTLLARNCNLGVLLLSGISVLPILCEFVTFPCSKVYVTWQLWRRTTSIQYTRTSSTASISQEPSDISAVLTEIIREVATVPGTDWVGTNDASHTTLLRKISDKCVFSLHFAAAFFNPTYLHIRMCFSASGQPGTTH